MQKSWIVLLLILILVILSGCSGGGDNKNEGNVDSITTESYIEKFTDYMILENGCVIVVSKTTNSIGGQPSIAVACPIVVER